MKNAVAADRSGMSFLDAAGLARLAATGVLLPDSSTLSVSSRAVIAPGAVLHPNVVIECDATSSVWIEAGAVLHVGTHVSATGGGTIRVGTSTVLGPGGCTLVAEGENLTLGALGRFRMALVIAPGSYGDGCQVLGPIEARDCALEGGRPGDWPDVDARGALLKGAGRASGIVLRTGEVVNGSGDFRSAPVERQSRYHPAVPARDALAEDSADGPASPTTQIPPARP